MTLHPDRNRSLIRGWPFTSAAGGISGTVALIAFMTLGGCSHVPIDTPAVQLDFPSPLSGPGAPSLDRVAGDQINNGYQALERGDVAAARTAATAAGDGPASRLLSLQAKMSDGAKKAISGLEDLTESQPTYAAAWVTLSVAAERSKNELLALESAATGVELWPNQRWIERAGICRLCGSTIASRQPQSSSRPSNSMKPLRRWLRLDRRTLKIEMPCCWKAKS